MTLVAIQLANDSLSHRSSHHFIVTRSPNHWWASSWAITLVSPRRGLLGDRRVANREIACRHREAHGPWNLELGLVPARKRLARLGVLELCEEIGVATNHHPIERDRARVEVVVKPDLERIDAGR